MKYVYEQFAIAPFVPSRSRPRNRYSGDRSLNVEKADWQRKFGTLIIRSRTRIGKPLQFTAHRCCQSPASPAPYHLTSAARVKIGPTLGPSTVPPHNSVEAIHRIPVFQTVPAPKSRFHLYPCHLPQPADELSETEAKNMKRWWRTSANWNPARACGRWIHLTPGSYRVCLIICDFKESNFINKPNAVTALTCDTRP